MIKKKPEEITGQDQKDHRKLQARVKKSWRKLQVRIRKDRKLQVRIRNTIENYRPGSKRAGENYR
jgi:hypothetical protein